MRNLTIPRMIAVCFDSTILEMDAEVDEAEAVNSDCSCDDGDEMKAADKMKDGVEFEYDAGDLETEDVELDDDEFEEDESELNLEDIEEESEEESEYSESEEESESEYSESDSEDSSELVEPHPIRCYKPITKEMEELINSYFFCAFSTKTKAIVKDDSYEWSKVLMLSESAFDRIFVNRIEVFVSGLGKISEKTEENIEILKSKGLFAIVEKITQ